MGDIIIAKANKRDFLRLAELDFTLQNSRRFDVLLQDDSIALRESELATPVIQNSADYADEIRGFSEMLLQPEVLALIAYYNKNPAGYILSHRQQWPGGVVFVVDGILVANEFRGKDIAQQLILHFIEEIKQFSQCRGFSVELDTEKYEACHLFLKIGAKFAGTKFYIYSNEDPREGTKEAIYFFYKV